MLIGVMAMLQPISYIFTIYKMYLKRRGKNCHCDRPCFHKVKQLNSVIVEKKSALAPIIKELRSLRQQCQVSISVYNATVSYNSSFVF